MSIDSKIQKLEDDLESLRNNESTLTVEQVNERADDIKVAAAALASDLSHLDPPQADEYREKIQSICRTADYYESSITARKFLADMTASRLSQIPPDEPPKF